MALANIVSDLPNELGMYYNWDFTKSLVDTVNGKEAVLVNSATRSEIGVKILASQDEVTLGNLLRGNTVIEVDITDNPCSQNSENSRVVCFSDDNGFVYKASSGEKGWGVYLGAWNFYQGTNRTNKGYIQNCTLKFVIDGSNFLSVYKDNELLVTHEYALTSKHTTWMLGSSEWKAAAAIGLTVTGVRVYALDPDIPSIDGHAETYTFYSAHMKALADAIREKTGRTGGLNILSMIEAIGIQSGGGGSEMEEQFKRVIEGDANYPVTTLPDGLTCIRDRAFVSCTNLELESLPDGVTTIGASAFSDCLKLALTSLPDSLTTIESDAFKNCHNITLTSLPSGLTSIGSNGFSGCSKMELTSLPEGVTLGMYAFNACYKLALKSIPAGVTIKNYAFSGCSALTEITFEGKPNSIASNAFYSCNNLLTINVPWAEGEVSNAPWGASKATINYNHTEE